MRTLFSVTGKHDQFDIATQERHHGAVKLFSLVLAMFSLEQTDGEDAGITLSSGDLAAFFTEHKRSMQEQKNAARPELKAASSRQSQPEFTQHFITLMSLSLITPVQSVQSKPYCELNSSLRLAKKCNRRILQSTWTFTTGSSLWPSTHRSDSAMQSDGKIGSPMERLRLNRLAVQPTNRC